MPRPVPWRPTRLTPAQAEARQRAAAGHFPQVRQRRLSLRALRATPKTGRPARLTVVQWQVLGQLLRRGAMAVGFATEEWTLRRIAQVIRRQFGVTYHYRYLERPLKAHGFTVQRPMPRARERDERVVRAWLKRDWPALKKELVASGASLPAWTKRVTRFGPA